VAHVNISGVELSASTARSLADYLNFRPMFLRIESYLVTSKLREYCHVWKYAVDGVWTGDWIY
jgi:hypothetical protein